MKEENRWKMLQRHTVAREKLKIAYEQEILRTHANAKRLEENQPKPYSACMVLQAEFENQYELPSSQSRSTPDNKRWVTIMREIDYEISYLEIDSLQGFLLRCWTK